MNRLVIAIIVLVTIILGINEFVRVTPSGDGIIWFWISQKISSSAAPGVKTAKQDPSWSEQERLEILGHMTLSIENAGAAEEILRVKIQSKQQLTNDDVQLIIAKIKYSVSEASLVSDQALRKVHPDLPKQFREKYQPGLSAIARGLAKDLKEELARGAALYGEFKRWGKEHMSEFSYPSK